MDDGGDISESASLVDGELNQLCGPPPASSFTQLVFHDFISMVVRSAKFSRREMVKMEHTIREAIVFQFQTG